ncbi:MAG: hypothetical protein JWP14_366 [Frankiales bacterium]|nr:hypothetical protein [Frankiales bacterium]
MAVSDHRLNSPLPSSVWSRYIEEHPADHEARALLEQSQHEEAEMTGMGNPWVRQEHIKPGEQGDYYLTVPEPLLVGVSLQRIGSLPLNSDIGACDAGYPCCPKQHALEGFVDRRALPVSTRVCCPSCGGLWQVDLDGYGTGFGPVVRCAWTAVDSKDGEISFMAVTKASVMNQLMSPLDYPDYEPTPQPRARPLPARKAPDWWRQAP